MAVNLQVSLRDAYDCFDQKTLLSSIQAGFSPTTGLPQQAPNVVLTPPESDKPHTRRSITWNLNAIIMVTDDASDVAAVRQTVDALWQGASGIASATTGPIPNPQTAVNYLFDTVERIEHIWERTQVDKLFTIRNLPVRYEDRQGRVLRLRSTVIVNGMWFCDDPGDNGNMAWAELEQHIVDAHPVHRAQPAQWDPSSGAPGGRGRVVMTPGSGNDRLGTLSGNLDDCRVEVNQDQSLVTLDVSASAVADDSVMLWIRSITLELSLEVDEEKRRREERPKEDKKKPDKPKPDKPKPGNKGAGGSGGKKKII